MKKCEPGCTCRRHEKRTRSAEHRARLSESTKKRWSDPEHRERMSEAFSERQTKMWADPEYRENKVCRGGKSDSTRFVDRGYVYVKDPEHPLANSDGWLGEHRKVLYDSIGVGPHSCHWSSISGCERDDLTWGGRTGVCTDHLDGDTENNDRSNLVPSCSTCNIGRHSGATAQKWVSA